MVTSTLMNKKLRELLPDIYQKDPNITESDFLEKFLDIFQELLISMDNDGTAITTIPFEGVDQIINRVHEFFSPFTAPSKSSHELRNFLDWIADWVGLIQKYVVEDNEKRRIISRLVPVYKKRGTAKGLKTFIEFFIGPNTVCIYDTEESFGDISVTGFDPIDENFVTNSNYVFVVVVNTVNLDHALKVADEDVIDFVRSIILREKPAQTAAVLGFESGGVITDKMIIINDD